MFTFVLVLLLAGSNNSHEQLLIQGWDEKYQCQDVKAFFVEHPFIEGKDEVFKVVDAQCLRQRVS